MSLFVGVPHTRAFEGIFIDSMFGCDWPDFYFHRIEGFPHDEARNFLAKQFLLAPEKHSHMLMIDSDATWDPGTVRALLAQDVAVISPCIYRRMLPPVPAFGNYVGMQDGDHIYRLGDGVRAVLEKAERCGVTSETRNAIELPREEGDLMEVDGVGAHFLLVRRDVMERLGPEPFKKTKQGGGEDFYFCRRVKELGYKIYVDLALHTGHIVGSGFDYGLRQLLDYAKIDRAEMEAEHCNVGKVDANDG